jgi:hypothetical protein
VVHYTRLERLARDKHPNLLGPFVSYEENEVVCIQPLFLASKMRKDGMFVTVEHTSLFEDATKSFYPIFVPVFSTVQFF